MDLAINLPLSLFLTWTSAVAIVAFLLGKEHGNGPKVC